MDASDPARSGPKPPLIGLAHGSRHPRVTAAIETLLAAVAEIEAIDTRAAYLDLVEPDLASVAAGLRAEGHDRAVVVPLLFTSAFHATVDVPEAIAAAGATSGLELLQADVLGTGPEVEAALLESLSALTDGTDADVLLYAVGSSDATANAAVTDLAARLSRASGSTVRAGFGTAEPRGSAVLAELEQAHRGSSIAILPLFLAPGLLLDPLQAQASDRGWPIAPPLAERAAPAVTQRYRDCCRDLHRGDRYQDRAGTIGTLG